MTAILYPLLLSGVPLTISLIVTPLIREHTSRKKRYRHDDTYYADETCCINSATFNHWSYMRHIIETRGYLDLEG